MIGNDQDPCFLQCWCSRNHFLLLPSLSLLGSQGLHRKCLLKCKAAEKPVEAHRKGSEGQGENGVAFAFQSRHQGPGLVGKNWLLPGVIQGLTKS